MSNYSLQCCSNPKQLTSVQGVVCVNCGMVNSKSSNIEDSKDSYYFNELDQINGGELFSEKDQQQKNIITAKLLVTSICDQIKGLCFKDQLINQTVDIIKKCYTIRANKKRSDPEYLAFPKDLNLFYCACMIYVVNNNPRFVGKVSMREDVLNNCIFKCHHPEDKIKAVLTELEKSDILGVHEKKLVKESDKLTEGVKVFLNEMSAPGKIVDYILEIHETALRKVWFNGKKPNTVSACVIYHVFFSDCKLCRNAILQMRIKQHRGSMVKMQSTREFIEYYNSEDKKGLFLSRLSTRFDINLQIVIKCNDMMISKHDKQLEVEQKSTEGKME